MLAPMTPLIFTCAAAVMSAVGQEMPMPWAGRGKHRLLVEVPPRAWLGDGMPRCERISTSSTGADHTRIAIDDWDGDGRLDIVFGESYGCLFWFPNLGTAKAPDFRYYRMLFSADGLPMDAGMGSAPLVVDWDGDGRKDLLVGTHWNRVLFFRNDGTSRGRRLTYGGFIEVEGKPLELPIEPVVGHPKGIFKRDYYPVLAAADWNGDGRLDLLAGGYVTGRIYLFENVGQERTGLPRLASRGPLEADGKPLNVGDWCAAPTIADFDTDGDFDLISGCTPVTPSSRGNGKLLRYYQNVGTARAPELIQQPFPGNGQCRLRSITSPRAGDWNGDGLIDLVVAGRRDICLYQNVGTKHEPSFDLSPRPLRPAWGSAPLTADQFLDWDHDGRLDVVRRYSVLLNEGVGNPYRFGKGKVHVLPEGEHIAHPSGHGDDWFWPRLHDFDEDGRFDVLFGDWWGRVWFHRNLAAGSKKTFDLAGQLFKLANGRPLAVGPQDKDPTKDFTSRQGARTVFDVADFDRDGLNDLVVGDTFGIVRYCRNAGTREQPRFAHPVVVGNQHIRLMVDATDWNGDGWPDVIAGAANGIVRVYLNTAGRKATRFETGFDPGLPPIKQPRVIMADLNGDGDEDLYLPSTQGSVFLERSFLRHGYAKAKLLRAETRR